LFLSGLKGSPLGVEEFEKMMNFYERKNIDAEETVKSFDLVLAQTND
jgi:aspartyl/asparaginyl-tRNA synthetase